MECPRAALYIIPALPNVRDAPYFELVRATYINTVKSLAPAGACMCGILLHSCREYQTDRRGMERMSHIAEQL